MNCQQSKFPGIFSQSPKKAYGAQMAANTQMKARHMIRPLIQLSIFRLPVMATIA
jgi:hypothetical protein